MKVSARKDQLKVFVDGVEWLEYRDQDSPLLAGALGVSVRKCSHCLYGDLTVKGNF